jgi:hypothetical protein
VRKIGTEAIHPMPDRFVTIVDATLMKQVFDITQ